MKVMIKLDKDWEIEAEIPDEVVEKIKQEKNTNKTGYERNIGHKYYFADIDGDISWDEDKTDAMDNALYKSANYYSDLIVVEDNARADKLMRQLRRFAIEHREEKLDWNSCRQRKYYIEYDYSDCTLNAEFDEIFKIPFTIYFDTYQTAKLAIDTFRDELIWYFTEYKDSL